MHSRRRTYSVSRILPSYTAPLDNPTGSADLVLIRILEGTPTVSGQALQALSHHRIDVDASTFILAW